ncbi:unnamed protein product [Pleuronectes platessa]|uniref:Protein-tyrosine phosphatase receptor IA-2 ectodomain domain-containing protein n=1 Tax=Pleuronectes platessa TaxID=8262 RepID=A0A9N7TVS8_PLEPL|nr:unnamed protein product [Pleuronectes platessa]
MQAIQAPAGKKQPEEEPQKNDMKVKTQLVHVGVKEFSSRGKDRHFGYIITGTDSLTTDQGLDLMERLTQGLDLQATDLTQLSVLGPAMTFRVGANSRNITTADVVEVAGINMAVYSYWLRCVIFFAANSFPIRVVPEDSG